MRREKRADGHDDKTTASVCRKDNKSRPDTTDQRSFSYHVPSLLLQAKKPVESQIGLKKESEVRKTRYKDVHFVLDTLFWGLVSLVCNGDVQVTVIAGVRRAGETAGDLVALGYYQRRWGVENSLSK